MKLNINKVKSLYYKQGLSIYDVGEKLGVGAWQIIKVMKKHNMPRRTPAETNRLKFLKSPKSYQSKGTLTNLEKQLKIAGLMLYWAEGVKAYNSTVDFANSDPKMIKLFLQFLRLIYQVNESKLRVLLYCYSNQNVNKLVQYWGRITKISHKQFIKPYVRSDYKNCKTNKMPFGLIHIRYNDKRLFAKIKKDTKIFIKQQIH